MAMNTILELSHYNFIFTTAQTILLAALYSYYKGHGWLCMLPGSTWITSVIYWWYPDFSWRRYLDIAVVLITLSIQHIIAYNAEHSVTYYVFCLCGGCFFIMSQFFYMCNEHWASAVSHGFLHIMTSIGTMVLYSGKL